MGPCRGGSGSIPSKPIWNLWQTNWQWDRLFSEYLEFHLMATYVTLLHAHSFTKHAAVYSHNSLQHR
jgi:hypothetical protein